MEVQENAVFFTREPCDMLTCGVDDCVGLANPVIMANLVERL